MGEKNEEIINDLYTKKLKSIYKSNRLLHNKKTLKLCLCFDNRKEYEKVNKILKEVEKVKRTYPVKSEIESELEIIDFVTNDKRMKC